MGERQIGQTLSTTFTAIFAFYGETTAVVVNNALNGLAVELLDRALRKRNLSAYAEAPEERCPADEWEGSVPLVEHASLVIALVLGGLGFLAMLLGTVCFFHCPLE